ncbi:54S ribosomal protein L24, mitochondrial [Neolecta irregularis DAH-3]|uniref:Large ribosomal subunit protein bL28m n=1 Tax=Neolecta irregularis (strain DAH-3) TaxID=1198029 RepID=A0A1U7LNN7_NEOID|nr:54S ribosomal protein L24, mitochondrial [Neolecta irregularis DAH-3]|eukprot:OLL24203.1 54S ribosomal protein L24, mitochondrial [Neolecta irregularis DAH-3]
MVANANPFRPRDLHIDSGNSQTDAFLTQVLHKKNHLTRSDRSGKKTIIFNSEAKPVTTPPAMTKNVMNRTNRGLFAGRHIRYGNNVPHSKKKTRRSWIPNITHRRLHSGSMESTIKVKLTHRALRTIRKVGGVDNYVMATKKRRINQLGPRGWELREMVVTHRMIQSLMKAGKKIDTSLKRPRIPAKERTPSSFRRLLEPRAQEPPPPLPKSVKKKKTRSKMLARAAKSERRKVRKVA